MRHINALRHTHFQHLIPLRSRFINDMHREFARIVREPFKFINLQLNTERHILHLKRPRDFLVRDDFMNHTVEPEFVSFRIGRLEIVGGDWRRFEVPPIAAKRP